MKTVIGNNAKKVVRVLYANGERVQEEYNEIKKQDKAKGIVNLLTNILVIASIVLFAFVGYFALCSICPPLADFTRMVSKPIVSWLENIGVLHFDSIPVH